MDKKWISGQIFGLEINYSRKLLWGRSRILKNKGRSEIIEGQGWNWGFLETVLPNATLNQLRGIVISSHQLNEDQLIWKQSNNGQFSTKSAYSLSQSHGEAEPGQRRWRKLWKLKGPSRWKHLLWLVRHDRVLTNAMKMRRQLIDDPACPQ
jgi:hypothetical protein